VAELFRVQPLESVSVIELRLPEILDAVEFDRLNENMLAELNGKAAQHWVLDLTHVNYMGSAMLGLIVNIRQQIKSAGGRLVLCNMSSKLAEIFHACSMERLFTITKSRSDALKTLKK
jgi:anti-anti-sigma factor